MELTEISHISPELAGALNEAGIRTVKALKAAPDETLLAVPGFSGKVLKKVRMALEKVVEEGPHVKFEWPDNPDGRMLLWRDQPDRWARFIAGFYITADADEIDVLRHRAETRRDVFEVAMETDTPTHARSRASVPKATGDVGVSPSNAERYLRGD